MKTSTTLLPTLALLGSSLAQSPSPITTTIISTRTDRPTNSEGQTLTINPIRGSGGTAILETPIATTVLTPVVLTLTSTLDLDNPPTNSAGQTILINPIRGSGGVPITEFPFTTTVTPYVTTYVSSFNGRPTNSEGKTLTVNPPQTAVLEATVTTTVTPGLHKTNSRIDSAVTGGGHGPLPVPAGAGAGNETAGASETHSTSIATGGASREQSGGFLAMIVAGVAALALGL